MSREIQWSPLESCDVCGAEGGYDFMGDVLCPLCTKEAFKPLEVTCARCGAAGTSETFYIEEGDEWECPPCWERCEAEARASDSQGERHGAG